MAESHRSHKKCILDWTIAWLHSLRIAQMSERNHKSWFSTWYGFHFKILGKSPKKKYRKIKIRKKNSMPRSLRNICKKIDRNWEKFRQRNDDIFTALHTQNGHSVTEAQNQIRVCYWLFRCSGDVITQSKSSNSFGKNIIVCTDTIKLSFWT